jgi:hypothetical protein
MPALWAPLPAGPATPVIPAPLHTLARLASAEWETVERGGIVAETQADAKNGVALAAASRLNVSRQYFLANFEHVAKFHSGPSVFAVGKFSNPHHQEFGGLVRRAACLRNTAGCPLTYRSPSRPATAVITMINRTVLVMTTYFQSRSTVNA